MKVVARKVDEQCRVVLPESFAGRTVLVEVVSESEVRIKIKKAVRSRPSLDVLLARVTESNQHPPIEFGPPVGDESI